MIDVIHLFNKLGISYREVGEDLKLKCFFHEDKNPSFSISRKEGLWHCFSCKRSGNIYTLLYHLTGAQGVEAIEMVKEIAEQETDEDTIKQQLINAVTPKNMDNIEIVTPQYIPIRSHPYLMNRGFTEEEILAWNMGQVTESPYIGWIIIPIYQHGKLQNYFMRSTTANRKLYGKYSIRHVLAGLDSANDYEKPLYIVEGIFDMIFLRRVGIQVIASLTNRLYEEHLSILSKYKRIVLVPDNDFPGWELVDNATALLYRGVKVGVSFVPKGKKDTAECTNRELISIRDNPISLLDFISTEDFFKWKLERLRLRTLIQ